MDFDLAALESEIDLLLQASSEQDERVEALLHTGSAAARLVDLRLVAEDNARELALIEQDQLALDQQLKQLGL